LIFDTTIDMENKKSKPSAKDASLRGVKSKTIRTGRGRLVKQYPANPGFHGSGSEKQLNPEE